jgi:hypothetical protein
MSSKKRSGGRKQSGGRVTPKGTRPPEPASHHSNGDHEAAAPAVHTPPAFEQHVHGSQTANSNANRRAGRRGNR